MTPRRSAIPWVAGVLLAAVALGGDYTIFEGDGSDEPGFVPPPRDAKPPSAPPKSISSAETFIPFPGPPVVPQSRSEGKKPPRPPVIFTKIRTHHMLDWAATPNDVNNLLKKMKSMMNVDYSMEIKPLAEVSPDPEQNPILYRSGHYHFSFTPEERQKLRRFMLNGGMVIFNTGLGSQPFYDSARKELDLIFPEAHAQRLSSDHPIFHSYYDLDRVKYRPAVAQSGYRGDEPWFDGVTYNCRTLAVISRWCAAVGWEGLENGTFQAYESEDAQKLGINLFAYATAQRAWAKKMAGAMTFVDEKEYSGDKMFLTQVVYEGEWKTRHTALPMLLRTFNLKTEIPVKFGFREMRLSDPRLSDAPLLYLTGHENFRLDKAETAQLRQYLINGGFLLAEACCGRKGFDLAFRTLLQQIMPEYPLKRIPESDRLFQTPNALGQLGVTPALNAQIKSATTVPRLEGIEIDGHYAVIYSPFALAGGWEASQSPYAFGYDDAGSTLMGQNLLMYAITQ